MSHSNRVESGTGALLRAMAAFAVVAAISLLGMTATAAGPCEGEAHRQFDFWLGEWEVRTADGTLAGVNNISREHGGCVLHERYSTSRGYSGESLNVFDPSRKVWHQTWVDNAGTLLLLEGGLRGESMVLEGQTIGTVLPGPRMPMAAFASTGNPPTPPGTGAPCLMAGTPGTSPTLRTILSRLFAAITGAMKFLRQQVL